MPRYSVNVPDKGCPPLGSVMTPTITRSAQGWSSRGPIVGQPGTQAIAAPDPAAVREGVVSLAAVGQFMTWYAPNVIYPAIYYHRAQEHAPVAISSDNQMPVPAVRAPNVIVARPYRARKGGQRQVIQPQVVQSWRGMNQ